MNLLTTNSKLKKDGIETFSLPPVKTCPFASECKSFCYARKGFYAFPSVTKALEKRRKLTLNRHKFIASMDQALSRSKAQYIRIHSSGDFYSKQYIKDWFKIIRLHPEKQFYTYTKSVLWFKELWQLGLTPVNLRVIYSYGGKQDCLISNHNDRHCKVVDVIPPGYSDGGISDLTAAKGSNNRIAIVRH